MLKSLAMSAEVGFILVMALRVYVLSVGKWIIFIGQMKIQILQITVASVITLFSEYHPYCSALTNEVTLCTPVVIVQTVQTQTDRSSRGEGTGDRTTCCWPLNSEQKHCATPRMFLGWKPLLLLVCCSGRGVCLAGPFHDFCHVRKKKCFSEEFFKSSGLGECLHWHLHTSPYGAHLV